MCPQTTFSDGKVMTPRERVEELLADVNMVVFQFSGGRDSQIAMEYLLPHIRKTGVDYVACYVDTGAEFPSVTTHVIETAARLGVPLEILKGEGAVELFRKEGAFPHPIYKDCIHRLINKPVNAYAKKHNAAVIGGHRAGQNGGASSSKFIHKVGGKKLHMINPLYVLSNEEIEQMRQKTYLWPGYCQGFERTACYCCPFQHEGQWNTMREYYPDLWQRMKALVEELPVYALDDRPSQGILFTGLVNYWTKQGCTVKAIHLDGHVSLEKGA